MAKVLVLSYSTWGHVETLAEAVAEGVRSVPGATVTIKRVPELIPEDVQKQIHVKVDQKAPIATPAELADYDAIIFGAPTRFGNVAAQLRNFLDQTGGLWAEGKLIGKLAGLFVSTGSRGGQEATHLSLLPTFAHHGLVYVPIGYARPEVASLEEAHGNTPYGAGTVAGPTGQLQPKASELAVARYQGETTAKLAVKLFG
jgi:NAD(P)H dehydrogenase (quinone)